MGRYLKYIMVGIWSVTITTQVQATGVRITHCLKGVCPSGTPQTNITAAHELYALSSNAQTKIADWVAYRPSRETIATSKDYKRTWRPDPILPEDHTLEPDGGGKDDDYKWASKTHGYDRGHLAPLTLFADTEYWRTTNYYSNVAPMKANLNQGPWKVLEEWEKDTSYEYRSLYVLTGPIYKGTPLCKAFQKDRGCLPNANESHSIPTAYWKVITNQSGSKTTAFIVPQDVDRKANPCDYHSSIEDVEAATGLALFPASQVNKQNRLEGKLGCHITTAQQHHNGLHKG